MAAARALMSNSYSKVFNNFRHYSTACKKGLVLGAYTEDNQFFLTPVAKSVDKETKGYITEHLNVRAGAICV
ncbi:manganese ion Hypothetical protein [Nesidiocoris tenuis]|uniref:Uncharacterized protein n=1 Tax=Nesidiocoris tenuis TaxID=355587 RepID=A0ABN7B8L6_9HEMI|nr:manganese ion Hypothetical protein [Nesidiocoris tenuis]